MALHTIYYTPMTYDAKIFMAIRQTSDSARSFMLVYRLFLGDFEDNENYEHWCEIILFYFSSIIGTIILLNLLISICSLIVDVAVSFIPVACVVVAHVVAGSVVNKFRIEPDCDCIVILSAIQDNLGELCCRCEQEQSTTSKNDEWLSLKSGRYLFPMPPLPAILRDYAKLVFRYEKSQVFLPNQNAKLDHL